MSDPSPAFLLIFDMDGVLYRGEEALPDAAASLQALRQAGFLVTFLTNNAWATAEEFAAKMDRLGMPSAPEEYMTSAMGAAAVIRERHGAGTPTLVIGGPGLRHYCAEAGLDAFGPDSTHNAAVVVAGIDWEFTYTKLARAQRALLDGAAFYATNLDPRYPVEGGRFKPGAGSLIAAIATASGVTPTLIGKPSSLCVELLMERFGVAPRETLVIGDQLATDILAGNRAGCRTALITTGVSTAEEAESLHGDRRPTHVFSSLTELATALVAEGLLATVPR
ncbi:MAG TPA: HAD-IIA family hydrolase [bacterium]|nr:HAD-IIA family hydrolase [bacterium]